MILMMISVLAFADDVLPLPALHEPQAHECEAVIALRSGQPIPADLLDEQGLVRCSALVVPPSEYANLLDFETYATHARSRYLLDTAALQRDLTWHQERLAQLEKPPKWFQTPEAQRWAGRLEALVTFVAVGAIVVHLDDI